MRRDRGGKRKGLNGKKVRKQKEGGEAVQRRRREMAERAALAMAKGKEGMTISKLPKT